jgi:uncharacterized protein (DUF427 family)
MARAMWNGAVLAESDEYEVVEGKENKDAAWYYPEPKEEARNIQGHIAFWKGVWVER